MMIRIDERSLLPIYEQIVQQVKEQIAKGLMREGDRVSSVRELSAALLINPNTVGKAYQELERQGVITTVRGKGTFVAKTASSPGMEKERMGQLREQLRHIVVEARHLGMSQEQFNGWLREEISQYWGDSID